jgi:electron transfer flavoprotein alpha subunit
MTTLLLAEHDNKSLNEATRKALTAAKALGAPVHILVAGQGAQAVADAAAKLDGVGKVLLADDAALGHHLAEPLAALIVSLAGGYDAIVAAGTTAGKNVAPRVAALLDVMQVSEITKVVSPDTFERPIYPGNAIQTVQSSDAKKVITVRGASFAASPTAPPLPRSRPSRLRRRTAPPASRARRSPSRIVPSWPRPRSSSRVVARSAPRRPSPRSSSRSPTGSARPWAPRAPRWTPATRRTTGRSARPAWSWRRIFTSP